MNSILVHTTSTHKSKDSKDRILIYLEAKNWFARHLLACPSQARPEELRYPAIYLAGNGHQIKEAGHVVADLLCYLLIFNQ
jgi:hypothetical protein